MCCFPTKKCSGKTQKQVIWNWEGIGELSPIYKLEDCLRLNEEIGKEEVCLGSSLTLVSCPF
jgi:hypothetical protein